MQTTIYCGLEAKKTYGQKVVDFFRVLGNNNSRKRLRGERALYPAQIVVGGGTTEQPSA